MPLKLKGSTKTMPRYDTILYDDNWQALVEFSLVKFS